MRTPASKLSSLRDFADYTHRFDDAPPKFNALATAARELADGLEKQTKLERDALLDWAVVIEGTKSLSPSPQAEHP